MPCPNRCPTHSCEQRRPPGAAASWRSANVPQAHALRRAHCQALAAVGPPGCCGSALLQLMLQREGGRERRWRRRAAALLPQHRQLPCVVHNLHLAASTHRCQQRLRGVPGQGSARCGAGCQA